MQRPGDHLVFNKFNYFLIKKYREFLLTKKRYDQKIAIYGALGTLSVLWQRPSTEIC